MIVYCFAFVPLIYLVKQCPLQKCTSHAKQPYLDVFSLPQGVLIPDVLHASQYLPYSPFILTSLCSGPLWGGTIIASEACGGFATPSAKPSINPHAIFIVNRECLFSVAEFDNLVRTSRSSSSESLVSDGSEASAGSLSGMSFAAWYC